MKFKKPSEFRTFCREQCGLSAYNNNVPVYYDPFLDIDIKLTGTKGGYYTNGGSKIYYPSTYSKKGWSNMWYSCDDRKITVGPKFIEKHDIDLNEALD